MNSDNKVSASRWRGPIPVVDLFAGPGGLGEGFSRSSDHLGRRLFDVRVSIEKDPVAHRTLTLRALFRAFDQGNVPDCYYDYLRGDISRDEFMSHPATAAELQQATQEAICATLGVNPPEEIDGLISRAIGNSDPWVLIGGPPCQAYSVVGRARRRGSDPDFEKDEKHFLYREYLRIIQRFQPAVFVMENVKGLLTSTHGGSPIFDRILEDLTKPSEDLEYEIRSFVVPAGKGGLQPTDFIIESEKYGVPQMRHRVILLGVRRDFAHLPSALLDIVPEQVSLRAALADLPPVRSRLSREPDSFPAWLRAISHAPNTLKGWWSTYRMDIESRMSHAIWRAGNVHATGGSFLPSTGESIGFPDGSFGEWIRDAKLGGICQHETRQHMRSDLHRYMFAACFVEAFGYAPKLGQFPERLLPEHKNVGQDEVPFKDRFRVQPWDTPSTTVVSHIAKDGHYYIHPDPAQCRSLTVREAARLQTFPDNYFFEGNRTEQYTQVGNAVPPYLARQLGKVVADLIFSAGSKTGGSPELSIPCHAIPCCSPAC